MCWFLYVPVTLSSKLKGGDGFAFSKVRPGFHYFRPNWLRSRPSKGDARVTIECAHHVRIHQQCMWHRGVGILKPWLRFVNFQSTTWLTCYNDWGKARNRSLQTDIIFLDLSKAFDSVPHERLLLKLQRHGIDGSLLLWIRNFLTNRRQRVVVRGNCSDWSPVISGVPQGTILGPILFIIYINDISANITSTVKKSTLMTPKSTTRSMSLIKIYQPYSLTWIN